MRPLDPALRRAAPLGEGRLDAQRRAHHRTPARGATYDHRRGARGFGAHGRGGRRGDTLTPMTRASPRMIAVLFSAAALLQPAPAIAAGWEALRAARPELFHEGDGFRIARQHAPTPDDIPAPARVVTAHEARALMKGGAVAIDVFAAPMPRYDELDGTWMGAHPRQSLPGAFWLPEVGRGVLSEEMARWYAHELARLTGGDKDRALVIFCVADCWMSWNAARRAAEGLGYRAVAWFRLGADGWLDEGWTLAPAAPVAVRVD
jgi:PQQ-dependent catabolism-associated CXXCW motif protein